MQYPSTGNRERVVNARIHPSTG